MLPLKRSVKKVTRQAASALLSSLSYRKDEAGGKVLGGDVYILEDGRVLGVYGKRRMLWSSIADYERVIEALRQPAGGPAVHILARRLPSGKDFPALLDELIARLARITGCELDFSDESIDRVEKRLKTEVGQFESLAPDVFEPLVAYCMECIRRTVPFARTEMRLDRDGVTWEPWIRFPDGTWAEVFPYVYEVLSAWEPVLSLRYAVTHAGARKVIPSASAGEIAPIVMRDVDRGKE